jgi:phosphatidylserine/phosphatidylglycerophosphate/cardiolipin synthase-like enzyme
MVTKTSSFCSTISDDFRGRKVSGDDESVRLLAQNGFNEAVFKVQGKVHNKGIIRDGEQVLVSSQNWSGDGFLRNRDAGLIIEDRAVAQYFARVFDNDWTMVARPPFQGAGLAAVVADRDSPPPTGMVRMSWSDFFGE